MKIIYIIPFILLTVFQSYSQSVVNIVGGDLKNTTHSIQYSIGEIVVSTENSAEAKVSQGFLQPFSQPLLYNPNVQNIDANTVKIIAPMFGGDNVADIQIEYGLTTTYGNVTSTTPVKLQGYNMVNFETTLSGLQPSTVYHYRIKLVGIGNFPDKQFTTNSNASSFIPNRDGWNFSNSSTYVWPSTWWQQFNYNTSPYSTSSVWLNYTSNVTSDKFPNWDLYVDAYGETQCYTVTNGIKAFSPNAVSRWNSIKTTWGGSCYGFALTSLMFYNKIIPLSQYSTTATILNSVPINNDTRKLINKYFLYQMGRERQTYFSSMYRTTTPLQTLQKLQTELVSNTKLMLFIFNYTAISATQDQLRDGHAIVPYKVVQNPLNTLEYFIYVYDSNYPNDNNIYVTVNVNTGNWKYYNGYYNGYKYLLCSEPVETIVATKPLLKRGENDNSNLTEIYSSTKNRFEIKTATGFMNYYKGKTTIDNIDGFPIYSMNQGDSVPVGYWLNDSIFSIGVENLVNEENSISIVKDSVIFVYSHPESQTATNDSLQISNNSLIVRNITNNAIDFNIDAFDTQDSIWVAIRNCNLQSSDSVTIVRTSEQSITIENQSNATVYDLEIISLGNENYTLSHQRVNLPSYTTHIIDYKQIDNKIFVFEDQNNDNTVNDTLFIANKLTGINNQLVTISAEIYPNPNFGIFTLTINDNQFRYADVTIKTATGQVIKNLKLTQAVQTIELNVAKGIYFVEIQTDKGKVVKKLIVE